MVIVPLRMADSTHSTLKLGDGKGSSAPHSHPYPHPKLTRHEHAHPHSHGSHISPSIGQETTRRRKPPTDFDMNKVRRTLKQLMRDWIEEFEELRMPSFFVCINISDVPMHETFGGASPVPVTIRFDQMPGKISISWFQVRDLVPSYDVATIGRVLPTTTSMPIRCRDRTASCRRRNLFEFERGEYSGYQIFLLNELMKIN
jgi:hypothetical protein